MSAKKRFKKRPAVRHLRLLPGRADPSEIDEDERSDRQRKEDVAEQMADLEERPGSGSEWDEDESDGWY